MCLTYIYSIFFCIKTFMESIEFHKLLDASFASCSRMPETRSCLGTSNKMQPEAVRAQVLSRQQQLVVSYLSCLSRQCQQALQSGGCRCQCLICCAMALQHHRVQSCMCHKIGIRKCSAYTWLSCQHWNAASALSNCHQPLLADKVSPIRQNTSS